MSVEIDIEQLTGKYVVNMGKTQAFDIRIDRTTVWGNPFHVTADTTREQAIRAYRDHLKLNPYLVRKAQRELAGKVLGCWCKPAPCHGDILAFVANGGEP
jgi:hypothetical protein